MEACELLGIFAVYNTLCLNLQFVGIGSYFVEPFCIWKCIQHMVRLTKKTFCSSKPLQVPSAQLCPACNEDLLLQALALVQEMFPVKDSFLT